MSEWAYVKIYFKKLTPELIMNSLIWLDEENSQWKFDEKKKKDIKDNSKHKFKLIFGDKVIEGGDPKGELVTIKFNPQFIKIFKDLQKTQSDYFSLKGDGKKEFKYKEKRVSKEEYRDLCDKIDKKISKKIDEYIQIFPPIIISTKNFKSNLGDYGGDSLFSENTSAYNKIPSSLWERGIMFYFTKKDFNKETESTRDDLEVDNNFDPKKEVNSIFYNFHFFQGHIEIDPLRNDWTLWKSQVIKEKLIRLCKSINATKGLFTSTLDLENEGDLFYPKDIKVGERKWLNYRKSKTKKTNYLDIKSWLPKKMYGVGRLGLGEDTKSSASKLLNSLNKNK